MNKVIETYSRIWPFIRAQPLLAALPLAVELTQHVAEIELGLYASGGVLTPEARQVRLAFGVVKILGMFVTLVVALHQTLGYRSLNRAPAIVWSLNFVDAGVVVLLAIAIGSSFFTVYRWAADRAGAATWACSRQS